MARKDKRALVFLIVTSCVFDSHKIVASILILVKRCA